MHLGNRSTNKNRLVRTIMYVGIIVLLLSVVHSVFSAQNKGTKSGGYMIGAGQTEEALPYAIAGKTRVAVQPIRSAPPVVVEKRGILSSLSSTDEPEELVHTLEKRNTQIASLARQIKLKDRKIGVLEERLHAMERKLEEREAELYISKAKPKDLYEVKKGDSLWRIAKRADTYANPYMWIKIYNANMTKISNKNLIYPGQLLELPR